MKKILLSVLTITIMLALVACSNTNPADNSSHNSSEPPLTSNDESNTKTSDTKTSDPSTPGEEITRPPASAELSKEWSSFEFELQGKLYTLPISYSELAADGWAVKHDEELDETLGADEYIAGYITLAYNNEENTDIGVQFANMGDKELSLKECYVSGIQLFENPLSENTVCYFPGGFTLGSTMDDVEALYGQTGKGLETSTTVELKYQKQNYDDVMLTFVKETGKLEKMRMTNAYLP